MARSRVAVRRTVLAVDVGGTNVKVRCTGVEEVRKHASGVDLSARAMVEAVVGMTSSDGNTVESPC